MVWKIWSFSHYTDSGKDIFTKKADSIVMRFHLFCVWLENGNWLLQDWPINIMIQFVFCETGIIKKQENISCGNEKGLNFPELHHSLQWLCTTLVHRLLKMTHTGNSSMLSNSDTGWAPISKTYLKSSCKSNVYLQWRTTHLSGKVQSLQHSF